MKVRFQEVMKALVEKGDAQHRITVIPQKFGGYTAHVEELVEGPYGFLEQTRFETFAKGDSPELAIENAYKAAGKRERRIDFDELEF